MKRHTSKSRRHSRPGILEVRVMSPRIVWFGCLRCLGKLTKLALILALLGGAGWGMWRVVQQALYKNPDFHLRIIALNANPVIDELGVATAAGIDLAASPSLFDIDVTDVAQKLRLLPEIADAQVERHLPGTLAIHVTPRQPRAWIACPAAGFKPSRQAGSMLVDQSGVAYPCPERLVESSAKLPIIILPASDDHPICAGKPLQHPELEHCLLLLEAAQAADPEALQWIESIRQANDWSLLLITRQGTAATFGLGDHARQIASLRAALDHAGNKGYLIETINLIPKYNIPITVREEPAAPPRAIPVAITTGPQSNPSRRSSSRLRN